jgi:hypothetical protein
MLSPLLLHGGFGFVPERADQRGDALSALNVPPAQPSTSPSGWAYVFRAGTPWTGEPVTDSSTGGDGS